MPEIVYFTSPKQFRAWLKKHHNAATELWLGFYKAAARKKGITYAEALDEALCFGWIDGIRKTVDAESYTNRFTPRKLRSNWSNINIGHVQRLIAEGQMTEAGLKAFEARDAKRTGVYSFENKPQTLPPLYEKKLKANKKAWKFFQSQPPSYRRTAIFWVVSAKQEATRAKRLQDLIDDSVNELRIKPLRRN